MRASVVKKRRSGGGRSGSSHKYFSVFEDYVLVVKRVMFKQGW